MIISRARVHCLTLVVGWLAELAHDIIEVEYTGGTPRLPHDTDVRVKQVLDTPSRCVPFCRSVLFGHTGPVRFACRNFRV